MKDFNQIHKQLGSKWNKLDWMLQNLTGGGADAIEAETKVGRDLAEAIEQEQPVDTDASVVSFLGDMGGYLASRIKENEYRFQFQPIRSANCNAFALPGGFVFVTRGLMEFCQWQQDEIGFVVAHEMGHVVCRHARSKIKNDLFKDAVSFASPINGLLQSPLQKLFKTFVRSEYSKERELAADDFAVRLIHSAGFSLKAPTSLFDRLPKSSAALKTDERFSFFGAHPSVEERIANIQRTRKQLESA